MSPRRRSVAPKLISSLLLACCSVPAYAQWVSPELIAEEARIARAAAYGQPKEITPGCVSSPLPATPQAPTYAMRIDDSFLGLMPIRFDVTAWRVRCNDSDYQLVLTLDPYQGAVSIENLFQVRQGGQQFNSTMVTSTTGAPFNGALSRPTSVLLQYAGSPSQAFDDDAALTIHWIGFSTAGAQSLEIPSATASTEPPAGIPVDDRVEGAWFNPATDGQGFLLDVDPVQGVLSGGWYTATSADGDRDWFTFLGTIGDNHIVDVEVYKTTGVKFNESSPVDTFRIGEGRFQFNSCTDARFTFSVPELSSSIQIIPLSRVTTPPAQCQ